MAEVVSIWMDGLRGQIMDKKLDFEGKVQKSENLPESLSRTQHARLPKDLLPSTPMLEGHFFCVFAVFVWALCAFRSFCEAQKPAKKYVFAWGVCLT